MIVFRKVRVITFPELTMIHVISKVEEVPCRFLVIYKKQMFNKTSLDGVVSVGLFLCRHVLGFFVMVPYILKN